MTVDEAIHDVEFIGIDTMPFIYFVERNVEYYPRVQAIFRKIEQGSMYGFTSMLTLTEVLIHPLRTGDTMLAARYQQILVGTQNVTSRYVKENVALTAADLRARYRLKTPDAIQLATAISEECEAFLTNDRDLRRVTEISVLILDDLTL